MNELFEFEYNALQEMLIVNHQEGFSYNMSYEDDVFSVTTKLNEQQSIIDEQKIAIGEMITDYKKLEEENEMLAKENEQLQIENKRLREELNDCEKFRYTVFKRMGELNDE